MPAPTVDEQAILLTASRRQIPGTPSPPPRPSGSRFSVLEAVHLDHLAVVADDCGVIFRGECGPRLEQIAAIRAKEIYEGALAASRAQAERAREAPVSGSRPDVHAGDAAGPLDDQSQGGTPVHVPAQEGRACGRPPRTVSSSVVSLGVPPALTGEPSSLVAPPARRPRGRPPKASSGADRASRARSVPTRGSPGSDNPRVGMTLRSSPLVVPQPAASRRARSVPRKRTTPAVSK